MNSNTLIFRQRVTVARHPFAVKLIVDVDAMMLYSSDDAVSPSLRGRVDDQ